MDEIEELQNANPISADEARDFVAIERQSLVEALRQEDEPSGESVEVRVRTLSRAAATRGLFAAAAALVLVFVGVTVVDRLDDQDMIEASVLAPAAVASDTVLLQSGDRGFDRATDLLVVHFDYQDRGDAHAAVAAREVATWFQLEPVVVAGTQSLERDESAHDYSEVMDAAWDSLWLDATQDRPAAFTASIERWLATLDAGGHVWIAEGGVSDFTVEVVREIARRRPALKTQSTIRVMQPNDVATVAEDLTFLQANTSYRRSDSGDVANGSADLNEASPGFAEAVLSGCHEAQWSAAFDYLETSELDFSDAALLLQILGVGTEQVASPSDFAAFFVGDQPDAKMRSDS